MSHSSASRDPEEVRKSIRTLTSLLHRFNVQKSPSKHSKDIPPLLRHFTTLLTRGERKDEQAKKVIAVTGAINAANQVKVLVVAQNRLLASSVQTLSLKVIEKGERSLEEVLNGGSSVPLATHIADVWVALTAFDPSAPDRDIHVESLELFFLSRSYRKFLARFKEGKKLCGDRWLYEVIDAWLPNQPEISCKWVAIPDWLLTFEGIPPIKSRTLGEEIQWEFSDDTKQAWAMVLRIILKDLHDAIEDVKPAANMKGEPEKKAEAMRNLNVLCLVLYYFVAWDEGIVKTLFTKTNIVAGITTTFMPESGSYDQNDELLLDEIDDEIDELVQEPDETKGQQVYRYLKTLVAWHAAVHNFCRGGANLEILRNLEIGLIELPPSSSTVLTLGQVSDILFARFPNMKKSSEGVLSTLETRYANTFAGCVHSEAMLMGLVNYYGAGPAWMGQDTVVEIENAQFMQNIVQPMADAGSTAIAVSKKCCWCCDWLGRNLDTNFQLPGTHGLMFPWDPPVVGVDLSVLERLEAELWGALYDVVVNEVQASLYSRHSSAASSFEGTSKTSMRSVRVTRAKRQGE